MESFEASSLSTGLVAADSLGWTRSELHARMFLARYPNERTREGYAQTLKQFFGWCAQIGIEPLDARRNHIELFCRDLEMHGRQPSTVAAKMNALAGFFRYAQIDRLIDENPMAHVQRPKVARESTNLGLSRPEVADCIRVVMKEYPIRDQALIVLLAYNGLRVSEVCGLDVEHITKHEGQPLIHITRKGGKKQRIPLHPKPAWLLEAVIEGRDTGPVFTTATGRRIDRQVIARVVRNVALGAGITKRVTPHSFRHSFVTLSLDSGRSERDVAASVGHADTRLVSYYDRARDSIVRNTTYSVASLIEGSL